MPDSATAFLNFDVNIFRRALYLTLHKCCDVTDVVLKINGRELESYTRFANLLPVASEECWNIERTTVEPEYVDTTTVEAET